MFAQVIEGKVKDAEAMRAANESWQRELKPGAKGFLGSTGGVADDGTFIVVVRFASQEEAEANGSRPEQSTWWEETSKLFDGEPTFYNCPRVELMSGGGSDEAGFVQVMISKPKDVEPVLAMANEFERFVSLRPDLIGATTAVATDGTVIDTNYFTSEAAAREGEKKEMPQEIQDMMAGFEDNVGEVRFIDLRDPWFS